MATRRVFADNHYPSAQAILFLFGADAQLPLDNLFRATPTPAMLQKSAAASTNPGTAFHRLNYLGQTGIIDLSLGLLDTASPGKRHSLRQPKEESAMEIVTYTMAYPPHPDNPKNGYPSEAKARAAAYRKNPTKRAMVLLTGAARYNPDDNQGKPHSTC